MKLPISGGCACGTIRYEATAEPVVMLNCHCRDCQQSSGGPSAALFVVPRDAFQLTRGDLRFHDSRSEAGGETHRGFCAECGAPVVTQPDAAPGIIAMSAASLDEPSLFQPQLDVWTADAHPWDRMDPALPKFEKYPPPAA